MSGPLPAAIHITSHQQNILKRFVRRHTSSQRLVRRTRIILLANSGLNNEQIAQQLRISRVTVQLWRQRWRESALKLAVLESEGIDDKALMEWVESILTDQERCGAPETFNIEQVVQIIAASLVKTRKLQGCQSQTGLLKNWLLLPSNEASLSAFLRVVWSVF